MPTIPSSNSCRLRFSNGIMIRIKQRDNRYTYSYRQRGNADKSWRRIAVKYSRTCRSCQETQPNQLAHMFPGGCLSDEYGKFLTYSEMILFESLTGLKQIDICKRLNRITEGFL